MRSILFVSLFTGMLCSNSAFAQLGPIETFIEAPFQSVSPVTDGVVNAGEYSSSYFYSFVDLENPGNPFPGLNQMCGAAGVDCNDEINVPGDADLSATVHYGHDDVFLYIGFDVIDTFLNADEGDVPFNNDGVELVIDADADGADGRNWSLEGFKINTDTLDLGDGRAEVSDGGALTWEDGDDQGTFFTASSVNEGVGYVLEFRIPLVSLDIEDGPGYTPASTGSLLRTNFAINDIDVTGGGQGVGTHAMQWVYEQNPASPWGGAEEVWVVGLALTDAIEPESPCDFNADEVCNVLDIDLLGKEIIAGTNNANFDVNGDGSVNLADQDQWRSDAATENGFTEPYLPGDANLDGSVLVGDLNVVGTNWQQSPDPWGSGDFNADGIVDVADLNALALNWQKSIPTAAATAAVPEPASLALLAGALLLLIRRRR